MTDIFYYYYIFVYTGYTQKNGAVSMVNKGKPHHSFVYTLYVTGFIRFNIVFSGAQPLQLFWIQRFGD